VIGGGSEVQTWTQDQSGPDCPLTISGEGSSPMPNSQRLTKVQQHSFGDDQTGHFIKNIAGGRFSLAAQVAEKEANHGR
jgi:hypothetical protein